MIDEEGRTLAEPPVLIVEERELADDDVDVVDCVFSDPPEDEDRDEVWDCDGDTEVPKPLEDAVLGGMSEGLTVPVSSTFARHASAAMAPTWT